MSRLATCLWFNNNADEAVSFYTSVFPNARADIHTRYGAAGEEIPGRPSKNTTMTITFNIGDWQFVALNGGPQFQFSSAISFFTTSNTDAEIDRLFGRLSEGGSVLMPLAAYPFSPKYAWVIDKFGVSWQLNLVKDQPFAVAPCLMFAGPEQGRAEEAIKFYTSQFENSKIVAVHKYDAAAFPTRVGQVVHAHFTLDGQPFRAMDSGVDHDVRFSLAISFIVYCETQQELDEFWSKLAAGGQTSQCGWLNDKFGIAWQVVPRVLPQLLGSGDQAKSDRIMKALLQMTKLDIDGLQRAAQNR